MARRNLGTFGIATVLASALLAGCSDTAQLPRLSDLNPFAEKEVPLAGKRGDRMG